VCAHDASTPHTVAEVVTNPHAGDQAADACGLWPAASTKARLRLVTGTVTSTSLRLEIVSDQSPREVIVVTAGQVAEVGRATLSALGLSADPHMSMRHFSVECNRPELTRKQLPIFTGDIVKDKDPSSTRFESDLVPFKPCTDVVLVGRAYAPEGKPVTEMVAGLRVGQLRCGVAVIGDRKWQTQLLEKP